MVVHYSHGPYRTYRCIYPYHLRKYIFVSLGGYWPVHYRYARYHWYSYHPYEWYGYYPVARQIGTSTNNYYTYNYYYGDGPQNTAGLNDSSYQITPADHNTFADVRAKLAEQSAREPADPTLADKYFEEAVKAFEKGDYAIALQKFSQAAQNAPQDVILPFAKAQALFALGRYSQAATALRLALQQSDPEQEGVFYPRGLYADEEVLFEQIEQLAAKAEESKADADIQMLLGYHLLGVGETQQSLAPLQNAAQDPKNAKAARVLLDLARKVQSAGKEEAQKEEVAEED